MIKHNAQLNNDAETFRDETESKMIFKIADTSFKELISIYRDVAGIREVVPDGNGPLTLFLLHVMFAKACENVPRQHMLN